MTCSRDAAVADNGCMCTLCGTRTMFAALILAAAKSVAARLRRMGLLGESRDWAARAAARERCPLRTLYHGVTYCGRPFLHRVGRGASADGCGCPTAAKAKSPAEHCPLDRHNRPAVTSALGCTCKWCNLG